MGIYSVKWKSIKPNSIQPNSIQPNSIQQNGNLFSQTGIYSVKRESIQSNGIYMQLNSWRPKPGAIWPNQVAMVPISFAILFSRYGWGGKRLVQVCYRYRQSCTETVKSILVSIGGSIEVTPTRLPAISLGEAAHNSEPFKSTCIPIWSLLPGGV